MKDKQLAIRMSSVLVDRIDDFNIRMLRGADMPRSAVIRLLVTQALNHSEDRYAKDTDSEARVLRG
tara:strand:+ start:659 stop:856 length:198 start_codon:yes stop_codon:yes gene_type:complete